MKSSCQAVSAIVFLWLGSISATSAHGTGQHVVRNNGDPVNEDPSAEADRIANEVNAEVVDPKAAAQSAKESSESAKQAAVVANKVAVHSVKVTSHAKSALKHALHALHDARVDSKGMGTKTSATLQKAEDKLEEATKTVDHGKLKKLESADMQKGKMADQLQKKREGNELEQMKKDVKELRRKLKQKGGDSESDKELERLQADLDKLEQDADSGKSDAAVNDEMKAEIERLRNQIERYESKGGKDKGKELMKDVSMKPLDGGSRAENMAHEATPVQDNGIDIDTQMPYGDLEPFGREDTAQELTESSVRESDQMVDQLERAEVAEEKRSVFRALTRLRGAMITSFDGVARSQTGNIDEYNKVHKWRKSHPMHHLADEESDISKWAFPDNADLIQVRQPGVSFAETSNAQSAYSKKVLIERIRNFRVSNPNFSEQNCIAMYETKLKLGSAVPPGDFVLGCNKVCDSARAIKDYWGSGEAAEHACGIVASFGCVFDGTPPVTAAGIGC